MAKRKNTLHPDAPLRHANHKKPITRRDFLAQGFTRGLGLLAMGSPVFSMFANPRAAQAALSPDLNILKGNCGIATQGAGKIPFISFDLAGGASIAGSNVLVGKQGGQLDFLTTEGYGRMGLPGDMIPPLVDPTDPNGGDYTDTTLGLAFHKDSGFLRGILEKVSAATAANINGAVIPARSDNDTGNNPHNPMYGINLAGANGELLSLIGSRSSDSGGNSMSPASMINIAVRPTKIDRPSDVTGLVDTGKLVGLLNQADAVAVLESIQRISSMKLNAVDTKLAIDAAVKTDMNCQYVKAADLIDRYGDPTALNPAIDPNIVGSIFTQAEFDGDGEFRKTSSVMKLVMDGFAGAGTITMGGYDYHTGDRAVGERRDLRAGRCMGACLEYAARVGVPLMLYVFSDGSVFSNGTIDDSVDGRGKGVWTGDNSGTAASFFLVYDPTGRPQLRGATADAQLMSQQIGYFRADGSVDTSSSPAANNVNLLVETVILNYMALHGNEGDFAATILSQGLGNSAIRDNLMAFNKIGSIGNDGKIGS